MSNVQVPADTVSCDQEAIRTPGAIQPHGLMLVVERAGHHIRHAAGDIECDIGIDVWLNQPLSTVVGDALSDAIQTLSGPGVAGGFMGQLETSTGRLFDVSAHVAAPYVIVELEAAASERRHTSAVLDELAAAAAGFARSASLATLCERAAIAFRHLTGFDRVMVYRFLEDGSGLVLAEARRDNLSTLLNQHFPASDIPQQARELYVRNLIRVIPDAAYQPIPLRPIWLNSIPLDMTDSSLRSVSPIHLQYLTNMGVKASASVSIVMDGVLWGLIACHHDAPRLLPYVVRAACRSLAASLAREITAREEAESYRQRLRLRSFEDDIVALLSREVSLDAAFDGHLGEIGRMMNSDGVAVLRAGELVTAGICPSPSAIRAFTAWLLAQGGEPIYSSSRLSNLYVPALEFQSQASGVMAVILSATEIWILLWFRAEQIEVVNWAGNPHKPDHQALQGMLTPRASFALWKETVRGTSRPWSPSEVDAALRLRTAVLGVHDARRQRQLNRQLTATLRGKDVLLQQKEFLVGEINHRVQNSLQLVSSFLAIQSRASDSPDVHAALEEARRRISAISLVHRRLYNGDQIEMVDAGRYLEELCADTLTYMGQDWAQHLNLTLSPVPVSTDRAVSLGLLLTELLINTNKHAYAGAAGPLEIALIEDGAQIHLIVSDKGIGKVILQETGDKSVARKGFGSRIMEGLVVQLEAKVTQTDNHPGVRTMITMPIQTAAERSK